MGRTSLKSLDFSNNCSWWRVKCLVLRAHGSNLRMHELTNIEFLKKLPCLILIIDYRASQKSAHLRIFLNPGLGAKIHDKLTTWFAYISQNRETIETRAIWKVRHQGPQNSKTIFGTLNFHEYWEKNSPLAVIFPHDNKIVHKGCLCTWDYFEVQGVPKKVTHRMLWSHGALVVAIWMIFASIIGSLCWSSFQQRDGYSNVLHR